MAQAKHNNAPAGFNRRALLKLAPAALVAGAVPGVAVAVEETPVMRLFREWAAYQDWLDGPETDDLVGAELNEAYKEGDVLRDQTLALPCQGPADMVAKMLAATFNGQSSLLDVAPGQGLLAEARALVA